jgi:hypothetical protein
MKTLTLKDVAMYIYAYCRLWGYDLGRAAVWVKKQIESTDTEKATETLGKVVSWMIVTGLLFIAFGTIKALSR